MGLEFYYDETFSLATDLDPVDSFVGTGADNTFTLTLKTGSELAATITAGNLQYYQFNGGFVKDGNEFTLSSIPLNGSQIVAPGLVALTFSAYDQNEVEGETNPRVSEIPFYLGDVDTIHLYSYTNLPQFSGINISFVDLVTGSGADLTWVQLACSDPSTGLALTYAATGVAINTSSLSTYGLVGASTIAGASSLTTTSASSFQTGDYVIVDIGLPTSEIRKIASKTASSITFFTPMDYPHDIGDTVFTMGRKFWARATIPENAANNQAFNFWDLGLRRRCKIISKV